MNLFKSGQEKKQNQRLCWPKGKVVNIGNPGSGQRGTMEELMKAMGVDNSFFKSTTELTSSEQVKALCDGKIDAFGYSVGFPNGAMEQAATCAAKASPINLTGSEVQGLISGADYYAKAVIPKGTYTNQKKMLLLLVLKLQW